MWPGDTVRGEVSVHRLTLPDPLNGPERGGEEGGGNEEEEEEER